MNTWSMTRIERTLRVARWLCLAALPVVLACVAVDSAFAQDPPLKVTVYQVLGDKAGKPRMPKELKPYTKNLQRAGHKSFKISQRKALTLTVGKPVQLALKNKLGGARLTLLKSGKIRLEVVSLKKEKSGVTTKIPMVFVNDKFKTPDGKLMFLILEKAKPKKR